MIILFLYFPTYSFYCRKTDRDQAFISVQRHSQQVAYLATRIIFDFPSLILSVLNKLKGLVL